MRKGKNFYTLWTEPPLPVPSMLVKPPVHDNRSSRSCPVCRAKCTRRTPHAVTVAEVVPQDEARGASARNLPGQPSFMWRTREP